MVYTVVFAVTAAIVVIHGISADFLFNYTLLSLAIVGGCTALMSGGVFGLAGIFPPICTHALMTGQAVAGLVVSMTSIFTLMGAHADDGCDGDHVTSTCKTYEIDWAAFSYFCIAVLILLACIACFLVLERLPITLYYKEKAEAMIETTHVDGGEGMETPLYPLLSSGSDELSKTKHTGKLERVVRAVKAPALSVFFVFAVTLSLFPTISSRIDSAQKCDTKNRFFNELFVPFSFLLFNGFDLVGRVVPAYIDISKTKKVKTFVSVASCCRVIFFPLFLLCNVKGTQLPVVFKSDIFPIMFMVLFAFSNGLISSLCMMLGPQLVNISEQELTGNVMIFFLSFGLLSGSCLSFVNYKIGTGSW